MAPKKSKPITNPTVKKNLRSDISGEIKAQKGYVKLASEYDKLGQKGNAKRIRGIRKDESQHEKILKDIKTHTEKKKKK